MESEPEKKKKTVTIDPNDMRDLIASIGEMKNQFGEMCDQIKNVSERVGNVEQSVERPSRSEGVASFAGGLSRKGSRKASFARNITFRSEPSESLIGIDSETPDKKDEEKEESMEQRSSVSFEEDVGDDARQRKKEKTDSFLQGDAEPVRKSSTKGSFRESASRKLSRQSSTQSEDYDPDEESEDSGSEDMPLLERRAERGLHSRGTIYQQAKIAKDIPMPIRCLGILLGFVTVVLVWETTDLAMQQFVPKLEARLVAYLALAGSAAISLILSHNWIMSTIEAQEYQSSLIPSFAYALSTLFAAIGSWGCIASSVQVLVPKKMQLFFWGAGGVLTLIGTMVYAWNTRHNVLLDIASCATTLGLHDEEMGCASYGSL